MPERITIPQYQPKQNTKITLLGIQENLTWEMVENGISINIPKNTINNTPRKYVWVFKAN